MINDEARNRKGTQIVQDLRKRSRSEHCELLSYSVAGQKTLKKIRAGTEYGSGKVEVAMLVEGSEAIQPACPAG